MDYTHKSDGARCNVRGAQCGGDVYSLRYHWTFFTVNE